MLRVQVFICDICAENAYIVTDTATGCTVVIDPGSPNAALERALEQIAPEKRTAILFTHGHFDHIGAAAMLQKQFNLPVICHEAEVDAVQDPYGNASAFFGIPLQLPQITQTVREGSRIMVGETALQVLHTPGHTAGSVCYMTDELIFAGDTLFWCGEGRTDLPGGDLHALRESLARLGAIEGDRIIYSGHGQSTSLSAERRNNPWVCRESAI